MHLTQEQIEQYRSDGELPLGRVLDDATILEARARIDRFRREGKMDHPSEDPMQTSDRLLNASSFDGWFKKIVTSDAVLDPAESVLGPNIQYYQDNLFCKPANNGTGTRWHQDNIWWHADPPNILTIWIALDDVDRENGAVHYIRGSHSHLLEPTVEILDPKGFSYKLLADDQVDLTRAVSFNLSAGHAVMHHCMTIHGAPPNTSNRDRRGYTVHLMQAGLKGNTVERCPVLRGRMP